MKRSVRTIEIALIAFAIGAAFVIASDFIGILNFDACWTAPGGDWRQSAVTSCLQQYDIRKQVGFGLALNWSIGLTFLFPLFVYCACETANLGVSAIHNLVTRGMIVNVAWKRASEAKVNKLILRRSRTLIIACGAIAVLALGFIPIEYQRAVGQFYPAPSEVGLFHIDDIDKEADWSIAGPICRYTKEATGACQRPVENYWLNGVFAGAAHAYLVYFGVVVAVSFMVAFGLYVRFFFSMDLQSAGLFIVPDPTSEDPRRGFEELENFFLHAVAGCFVLFAMGYLVTLQNVYLRTRSASILDLILPFLNEPDALSLTFGAAVRDYHGRRLCVGAREDGQARP